MLERESFWKSGREEKEGARGFSPEMLVCVHKDVSGPGLAARRGQG